MTQDLITKINEAAAQLNALTAAAAQAGLATTITAYDVHSLDMPTFQIVSATVAKDER